MSLNIRRQIAGEYARFLPRRAHSSAVKSMGQFLDPDPNAVITCQRDERPPDLEEARQLSSMLRRSRAR